MSAKAGNQSALKMTDLRKTRFLEKFRELGFAVRACEAVEIGTSTLHDLKKRDPDFLREYNEIKESWNERIEVEMYRRAIHGVPRPVVQGGKVVMVNQTNANGSVTEVPLVLQEYSDRLLEFMARGRMPEKYGNKVKLDATLNSGVMVVEDVIELDAFEVQMASEEERRVKQLEEDMDESNPQ